MVFNVRYREDISLGTLVSDALHHIGHEARIDPIFFGFYLFVVVGVVSCGGWFGTRWWINGR